MRPLRTVLDLFRRRRQDAELEEELRFHLESHVAHSLRAGLDPDEARRRAARDLGGIEVVKEYCRDERRGAWLDTTWQDLRFGARMLRRNPGFTVVALLTLALCVGASTVLFSLADAALLKPLPFPEPERLVRVWDTNQELGIARIGVTSGNLADWRRHNRTLSGLAGYYAMGRTLRTDDDAVVVSTAQVSADFFTVFPVRPAIGRTFTPEEAQRGLFNNANAPVGADPVAVMSHRLWQNRFHGDPAILDTPISLERRIWRVVGVLPPGFAVPDDRVDLWIPWDLSGQLPRDQHYVNAAGRMKPGVRLDEVGGDLNTLAEGLEKDFPATNRGWRVAVLRLQDDLVGGAWLVLVLMLCGVGIVLLAACANLAGLQLVRAIRRAPETAVRMALGASRVRLARQHLSEGALIAVVGGGAGILVASWTLSALKAWGTAAIPRVSEAALDLRVAAFALTITAVVSLAFGLAPALAGRGVGPHASLKPAARGPAGAATKRWRTTFAAGQVMAAFMLLVVAGLLARTYDRLVSVDPGFKPDGVLVLPIFLDNRAFDSGGKVRAYYGALLDRLAAIPGVEAAGGATALPTSPLGPDFERPVWAEGDPAGSVGARQADVRMVTTGYFDTLGIEVLRGRRFDGRDAPEAPRVLMVNRTLARQVWPDQDPVGRRLVVDYSTAGTYPYEVVGVVDDVRFKGLRSEPRAEIYLPHAQRSYLIMNIAVRASGDPEAFIPMVRQALRDVDPTQPAHSITPLRDLVGATVARDRLTLNVVLAFALTALGLAVVGLYGVLSYSVGQRIPEIGVRLALGASRRQIIMMVLSDCSRILLLGLSLGLAGALALTPLVEGLLFRIDARDPLTFVLVAALLSCTTLAAAWWPARRAAHVDPLTALRHE
ncbi:MAG: ADOP family duplicated permease [Candidatus Polarisedimenticolia bacterium]